MTVPKPGAQTGMLKLGEGSGNARSLAPAAAFLIGWGRVCGWGWRGTGEPVFVNSTPDDSRAQPGALTLLRRLRTEEGTDARGGRRFCWPTGKRSGWQAASGSPRPRLSPEVQRCSKSPRRTPRTQRKPEPCGCAPHRPNTRIAELNRRRLCLPPAREPLKGTCAAASANASARTRVSERWGRPGVRGHCADHTACSDHTPVNLGPWEPLRTLPPSSLN